MGGIGFGEVEDIDGWEHHRSRCGPGGGVMLSNGAVVTACDYHVHTFEFPDRGISWTSDKCIFCSSGEYETKANDGLVGLIDEEQIDQDLEKARLVVWKEYLTTGRTLVGYEGYGENTFKTAHAETVDELRIIDLENNESMHLVVSELTAPRIYITKCRLKHISLNICSGCANINITSSKIGKLNVQFPNGELVDLLVQTGSVISSVNFYCSGYKHINIKDSKVGVMGFGKMEKVAATVNVSRSRAQFQGGDFRQSTFLMSDGLLLSDSIVQGAAWMAPQVTQWQKLKIKYNTQSGLIFGLLLLVTLAPIFAGFLTAMVMLETENLTTNFWRLGNLAEMISEGLCSNRECEPISLLQLVLIGRELSISSLTNIFLILVNALRFWMVIRVAQIGALEMSSGRHPRYGRYFPIFRFKSFTDLRTNLSEWRLSYAPLILGDRVLKLLLFGAAFVFAFSHGPTMFQVINLPK